MGKIKSIKVDYKKRELIIIHDIEIHGSNYKYDEIHKKHIPVPASFGTENEKIITFDVAEELGIINLSKLELMIYNR